MANIYGVDTESDFEAKDVRDAVLVCFVKAHDDVLNELFGSSPLSPEEKESLKKMDIKMFLEASFKKVGGDYNNPTKKTLQAVTSELKEFAKNFRAENVVGAHYEEITTLINKLKE